MSTPRSLFVIVPAALALALAFGLLLLNGTGDAGTGGTTDEAERAAAAAASLAAGTPASESGVAAGAAETSAGERSLIAVPRTDAGGPAIVGRVVDAAGRAVAGAEVACSARSPFEFDPDTFDAETFDFEAARERVRGQRDERADAKTDADGRFRVAAPAKGSDLRLRIEARRYLVLEQRVAVPADTDSDVGTLSLKTGALVSGRVLDRSGRPVANARVAHRPERERGEVGLFAFAGLEALDGFGERSDGRTDADGRFELAHVPPGRFSLRARHDRHPLAELGGLEVAPGGELADVVLTLEPGTSIAGSLLDVPEGTRRLRVHAALPRNDDGPQGALLAMIGDAGEMLENLGGSERSAEVAADGSFTLHGLAVAKTYRVWATQTGRGFASNAACSERKEVVSGATDVELRYEAGVTVTFTVVDAGNGVALDRLWVSHRLAGGSQGFDVASFVPASGGRAKSYPDGRVVLSNLRPKKKQTLTLGVEALGFAKLERAGIELPLVGTLDLGTLRLEPTPIVEVRVRAAADGTPVAGATVRVRERRPPSADGMGRDAMIEARGPGGPRSAKTDAEGRAVVNGSEGAQVAVTARAPEFAPYESEAFVVGERGATHEARLLRGGQVEVTVLDADGKPAPDTHVDHRAPSGERSSERTGSDGVVRFAHLAPGTHEFKLGGRGQAMRVGEGFAMSFEMPGGGRGDGDWKHVEVADEATASLVLEKAALASLSGTVRENGVPIAGAQVAFVKGEGEDGTDADAAVGRALEAALPFAGGARGARNRTDDAGRYELNDLQTGEHRLQVTHRERAMPAVVRVSLHAGANVFDVDLDTTSLRGTVRDAAGQPIAAAAVDVAEAGGDQLGLEVWAALPDLAPLARGARRPTTTDAQGRYELRGVQAGKAIVVRASAKGFASASSKPVTPVRGSTTEGVDVELAPAGSVRVHATSVQAPFASVQAEPATSEGKPPVVRMLRRGETTIDGLAPGTWKITLSVPGGEALPPKTVEVAAGKVVDVTF